VADNYPYHVNAANLPKFLEHVQSSGVPAKVTAQYASSVGFKSSNDRAIITVLKFIGFIDNSGVPSSVWKAYRNRTESKKVLAAALRKSYATLFGTYPDAQRKDNEALRNFFSSHTSVGEATLGYMVRTFKVLAEMADFESEGGEIELTENDFPADDQGSAVTRIVRQRQQNNGGPAGMTVNINIQLQIPATENAAIYESFFAAMKKNLLS